jgi:hypothetical protein
MLPAWIIDKLERERKERERRERERELQIPIGEPAATIGPATSRISRVCHRIKGRTHGCRLHA